MPILCASYFCVKLVRYSFLLWLPTYFRESLNYSNEKSATIASMFEIGGFFGALLCGVLADYLARGNRLLVAALMCFLVAPGIFLLYKATRIYDTTQYSEPKLLATNIVIQSISSTENEKNIQNPNHNSEDPSNAMIIIALVIIGLMIHGPDAVMAGAGTQDLLHEFPSYVVVAASGLCNGMGSIGSVFHHLLILIQESTQSWVIWFVSLGMIVVVSGVLILTISFGRKSSL